VARSDLLLNLVKASSLGDPLLFRKTLEALIAEERSKNHNVLANKLAMELQRSTTRDGTQRVSSNGSVHDLFFEITPTRSLSDLILANNVRTACAEIVEEHRRRELLRSYNLEPRHRLLLTGPPGNGKTSLAEALAHATDVPLIVARYDGLIASYLGETASRLKRLFEFVRSRACVFFLDEVDTLAKERGDVHETGEIKRVVSSLLLQIDGLPSYVLVVTATNHPELLDRAVWRRFQLRLELSKPTRVQIEDYFASVQTRLPFSLGVASPTLAANLHGANFSELEDFVADVARRYVLDSPGSDARRIVRERLRQWQARPRGDRRQIAE